MAKVTDPFVADEDQTEEYDEANVVFEQEPVTLADAAASAFGENLEGLSGTQEELDNMDFTKARFVGMSYDSLDRDINIGDEITFLVRARCVGKGDEERKADHRINTYVKMDVQSVVIKEEDAPKP
jgi:hypothetical protein